jgi:hypothetical protein
MENDLQSENNCYQENLNLDSKNNINDLPPEDNYYLNILHPNKGYILNIDNYFRNTDNYILNVSENIDIGQLSTPDVMIININYSSQENIDDDYYLTHAIGNAYHNIIDDDSLILDSLNA